MAKSLKKAEDMSDEELMAELSGQNLKPVESMSDEELLAELASGDVKKEQTLESKYLEPYVYPAMEKVAKIAEPIQTALQAPIAPFGYLANVASNIVQGKKLETEPYILDKPIEFIKKYGTSSALGRTINIPSLEKPISELGLTSRDIDVASQFPKLTQKISSLTPKQIIEGLADIPLEEAGFASLAKLAKTQPVQKTLTKTAEALREASLPEIEKALIRMSSESASEIAKLEKSGKYKAMAETLSKHGLTKYVTSPSQLLSKVEDKLGEMFGSLSYEMSNVKNLFDLNKIKYDTMNSLQKKYGGEFSGTEFDVVKAFDDVEKIVKSGKGGSNIATVDELIELKRNVADYVYELKKSGATDTVLGANKKAVYEKIWQAIDDNINTTLGKDHPFVKTNKEISNLYNAQEGIKTAKVERIQTPSIPETIIGSGIMAGVGAATGVNPLFAASIYPTMRYGTKALESGIPALKARGLDIASDIIYSPVQKGLPLQYSPEVRIPGIAAMSAGEQLSQQEGRAPQSIPTPEQAQFMGKGLVEVLADYQIPRDTKQILNNKQAVLAKVAQVTDNPQIVNMLRDGLEKHPDKLEPVVQMISLQFPDLFESDIYNRVNGKIFHPDPMVKQQMIEKAKAKVLNNGELTNTQKMMILNGLHKDGSLPPDVQ
jgi:hypothetical protein